MESNLSQSGLNAVGSNNHDVCTAQSVNTPRSVHTPSYDAVCHDDDEMTDTAVDEMMILLREKVLKLAALSLSASDNTRNVLRQSEEVCRDFRLRRDHSYKY